MLAIQLLEEINKKYLNNKHNVFVGILERHFNEYKVNLNTLDLGRDSSHFVNKLNLDYLIYLLEKYPYKQIRIYNKYDGIKPKNLTKEDMNFNNRNTLLLGDPL